LLRILKTEQLVMASGQYSYTIDLQMVRQSYINVSRNTLQFITKRVESAIIDAVENTEGFLDTISALHKLTNTLLSRETYPQLLQKLSAVTISTKEKMMCFIYGLLMFIPLSSLPYILYDVGFKNLAVRITNNVYGVTGREINWTRKIHSKHKTTTVLL
jgi:hypothetical protein